MVEAQVQIEEVIGGTLYDMYAGGFALFFFLVDDTPVEIIYQNSESE